MAEFEGAIAEIVSTVCSTALGLPVSLLAANERSSGMRRLVGCVQMTGAWCGAVVVSSSFEFVSRAAKIVFSTAEEPTAEDQRDALGEISNMIAGNLKALLPSPSYLALPTVSEGVDVDLFVLGCHELETVHLLASGDRLTVSVMKRNIQTLQ